MKEGRSLFWQVGLLVLLVVVIATGVAVSQVLSLGEHDVKSIERSEMAQVQQHLKDLVDLAHAGVEAHLDNASRISHLSRVYGGHLKAVVDIALHEISYHKLRADRQEISVAEAQRDAKAALRRLRYGRKVGNEREGYLWVITRDGGGIRTLLNAAHPREEGPIDPDKETYLCARGKGEYLFAALIDAADNRDGFVDYVWPRPGEERKAPKLAYVQRVEGWGWYVGTGAYIDDALEAARERARNDLRTLEYDNGNGYFWINDMGTPVPRMVMHPHEPDLEGKVLDDPKYETALVGKSDRTNLFVAARDEVARRGAGFIRYRYSKPTGDGVLEEVPKLSYVRRVDRTGWVIGSGAYLDDVEASIGQRVAALQAERSSSLVVLLLLALFALAGGLGVLWWLVHRHCRKCAGSDALQREVEGELRSMEAGTPVASPPVPPLSEGPRPPAVEPDVVAAARGLLQVVLEEQSKLHAFQAVMSQASQNNAGPVADPELAGKVRQLTEAVASHTAQLDELVKKKQ